MARKKKSPEEVHADWNALRTRISQTGEELELGYELVITEEKLTRLPDEVLNRLYWAHGAKPVHQIPCCRGESVHELHLFFAEGVSIFNAFQNTMLMIEQFLGTLPKNLRGPILNSDIPVKGDRCLVAWLRCMFNLSREYPRHTLRTEFKLGFGGISEHGRPTLSPSDETTVGGEFDPWDAVLGGERQFRWSMAQTPDQPETHLSLVNARFTKELFYASANAIDILLAESSVSPRPLGRKRASAKYEEEVLQLESLLQSHHGTNTANPSDAALPADAIMKKLGWSQPRVSRVIRRLFPNGAKEYRWLCESRRIREFLSSREVKKIKDMGNRAGIDWGTFADRRDEAIADSEVE